MVCQSSLSSGKMFLMGLVGGIASGKSSIIHIFQQLGCAVTGIDAIVQHIVQPGHPAHGGIVEAFGTESCWRMLTLTTRFLET
ncbi:hypothetical protein U0070_011027 [Myodes glareolus]|uniref:Dephospho-CoA kinase n=1 Tax=Myodes glareolus TaxID=447135 RepID=A0AAW0IH10_MYOGA